MCPTESSRSRLSPLVASTGAPVPGVGAGVGIGVCRADGTDGAVVADGADAGWDRGVPTPIGVCPRCRGWDPCCGWEAATKPGRGVPARPGVFTEVGATVPAGVAGVPDGVPIPGAIFPGCVCVFASFFSSFCLRVNQYM